jgi:phage shock protein PspC (stress-responsive transcriptional regulator)
MTMADELQKLQTLREQGALTEEEFLLAKKRVIDGEPAAEPVRARADQSGNALQQLRRSMTDRWIGGVAGGLAQMTAIPSWAWRILFILTMLLHGLGALVYLLLWIFVPLEQRPAPMRIQPQETDHVVPPGA